MQPGPIQSIPNACSKPSEEAARKRAEEEAAKLQLIADELNHRLKNVLLTASAVAWQTFGDTPQLRVYAGRLRALAAAHSLLAAAQWRGAPLRRLVEAELAPHAADDASRLVLDGPDLYLSGNMVEGLCLVLHELATNAAKYGSLSVAGGRVVVGWALKAASTPRLMLEWKEADGPVVAAPTRKGFGSTLIERSLTFMGGSAVLAYEHDGLRCRMELPLDGTSEAANRLR